MSRYNLTCNESLKNFFCPSFSVFRVSFSPLKISGLILLPPKTTLWHHSTRPIAMTTTLRFALIQMNPRVGDVSHNVARMTGYIEQARKQGAHLAVFPELAVCGYPPEDLVLREDFLAANRSGITALAQASNGLAVIAGFVEKKNERTYNAAGICANGRLAATYHKISLPNYGVFDERRYFTPGAEPLVLWWNELRVGVNICEDIWAQDRISEFEAAAGGAQILVNISASPYHFRKGLEREQLVSDIARRCRAHFIYVNLVGGQDELVFDGQALIYDPEGRLLLRSRQFEEELILADLELPTTLPRPNPDLRAHFTLQEERIELPLPPDSHSRRPPVIEKAREPLDEVFSALVLGTRDYVRKNGFRQVVLGLSGGIDSALTATIAVAALGAENVVGVLMPSRFTASASVEDAEALARSLNVRTLTLPIEEPVLAFEKILAPAFKNMPRDLAEENLQARVRAILLMALSNKFGWLVLSTSNKSESAVGYTTLYGDMAGGFAVLKDVSKTLVYALARWANAHAFAAPVIPERTITRPPSAELKPDQTDQDSLPPYDVLDRIIAEYVENDRGHTEMIARDIPARIASDAIRLIDRAEYKRRQAPPGIKITRKSFGKDRRMPITNGFKP
jgi:NAD+ synthase (glutamine-hydrolysing)